VLFLTMSVIWGVPYLLIKVVDDGGVSVPVLVLARVGVGAALLLPVALRRRQLSALRPYWRWLAVFAVVEIIAPWFFLSDAERHLSSSLSGLLVASVPIIGVAAVRLTGDPERLSPVRLGGLLLGLGGVALLAGPSANGGDWWSVIEVLLTALGYAIGPLVANRKLADAPNPGVIAVCLTWPHAVPSARVLAALAGLAVVCTAVAFLLFFRLIAEVGPARATVITYVNPAVAVALGVSVLGEPLTPQIVAAFALILAGSVLATRSGLRRAGPADNVAVPDGRPRLDSRG
jgi:drug/metabolite transporter (DMT)-like permease